MACPTIRAIGASPSALAFSAAMTTNAAAPSLTPGALPAVTVPSFLKAARSPASASTLVSARTDSSCANDERRALLLRDLDRDDLVLEPSLRGGVRRLAMALDGVGVLVFASDLELFGDVLAGHAHVALVERAPEAVVDHRVDERAVAHAQSFAHAREQVRGVAHRLHAAGDGDVDVAGGDPLRGEHDGLEARAADLVDRHRGDVLVQAAVERGLARGVLPLAGGDDVAHDALVDGGGIDAGAADGLADGDGAELRSGRSPFNEPRNLPVGVRTADTMTDSRISGFKVQVQGSRFKRFGSRFVELRGHGTRGARHRAAPAAV